jgi:hypothetical protein
MFRNNVPQSSFGRFQEICADQAVQLDGALLEAVEAGRPSKNMCAAPHPFLIAIAEAGMLLRKDPERPLTDRTLVLPEAYSRNVAAQALTRIINSSIVRTEVPAASFEAKRVQAIDTCVMAERNFANEFEDIRQLAHTGRPAPRFVFDEEGRPLFMRKTLGENSALALRDFAVNGVHYPAGSLARIDLDEAKQAVAYQNTVPEARTRYRTYTKDMVTGVAFMRLSAYAFPPAERGVMFPDTGMPRRGAEAEAFRLPMEQITELSTWACTQPAASV